MTRLFFSSNRILWLHSLTKVIFHSLCVCVCVCVCVSCHVEQQVVLLLFVLFLVSLQPHLKISSTHTHTSFPKFLSPELHCESAGLILNRNSINKIDYMVILWWIREVVGLTEISLWCLRVVLFEYIVMRDGEASMSISAQHCRTNM